MEKELIRTYVEESDVKKIESAKDGYYINLSSGLSFFLDKKHGKKPKKGDIILLYTYQGSCIRGVDLNGENIFFQTDEQIYQEREENHKKYEEEKQQAFEKNKDVMDKMYSELPPEFQQRIDIFRKNNPKFHIDYEHCELFCCQEAVKIANTLKSAEKVKEFQSANWELQKKLVPTLDDGHSGNTFNVVVYLAYWYLQQPEALQRIVGALSPLVGNKEYEEKNKRKKLSKNES